LASASATLALASATSTFALATSASAFATLVAAMAALASASAALASALAALASASLVAAFAATASVSVPGRSATTEDGSCACSATVPWVAETVLISVQDTKDLTKSSLNYAGERIILIILATPSFDPAASRQTKP
uniref:Uncharacterized protein n=2 Tax=Ixodes scapularis TaxID=6945 RepID=A0A1S4LGC1_IXOSC